MADSDEVDAYDGGSAPRGQRRNRRLAAIALAVVLVIGAVILGASRFQHHPPPVSATPAPPARPVRFTPLQPLGAGVDMDLGGYGMAAVVADRAYVGAAPPAAGYRSTR